MRHGMSRVPYRSRLIYVVAAICITCGLYLAKDTLHHALHHTTVAFPTKAMLSPPKQEEISNAAAVRSTGRHLLTMRASENRTCTPPAILEFPNDFMNNEQRAKGGFLFCVVIALYMFWAIAIVCDDYFVPALDVICEKMDLQTDVAGATFMALGSSAPELFASLIGVFVTGGDIGTGTILGSAVFNVLFVIGVCAIFSGQVLHLSWWPLVRDLMSYLCALLILILVIMDNVVMWYEAILMVCSYSLYLVLMFFNKRLESFAYRITNTVTKEHRPEHHLGYTGLAPARDVGDDVICAEHHHKHRHAEKTYTGENIDGNKDRSESVDSKTEINKRNDSKLADEIKELKNESVKNDKKVDIEIFEKEDDAVEKEVKRSESNEDDKENGKVPMKDDDDGSSSESDSIFDLALGNPLKPPKGKWKKICWILTLPINCCFYFTIPDVRKESCRKWYFVSFMSCIAWIAITSYVLVWMVTLIGFTFGVPDTVMGLTLVAFGSSVPDCMSSLFVARKGDGDMACSHTVGSNVFDILLCLGIPWAVKTTIFSNRSSLALTSHGLFISSFLIMASIMLTFLMMHFHNWKLTKKVGVVYILVYLVFISIACVIEMNVFGYFNPPMCKIHDSI